MVASIWGNTVEQFERAAQMIAGAEGVVAVEVNVSCPNLEDRSRMFAHSRSATAEAVHAASAAGLPLWVKLSPNVADLVEIAAAGLGAGAEALVLVNTLLGMAIDAEHWTYRLGSGPAGGGLSGPAIRPVALRAVHDCRQAFPRGAAGTSGTSCVDRRRRRGQSRARRGRADDGRSGRSRGGHRVASRPEGADEGHLASSQGGAGATTSRMCASSSQACR